MSKGDGMSFFKDALKTTKDFLKQGSESSQSTAPSEIGSVGDSTSSPILGPNAHISSTTFAANNSEYSNEADKKPIQGQSQQSMYSPTTFSYYPKPITFSQVLKVATKKDEIVLKPSMADKNDPLAPTDIKISYAPDTDVLTIDGVKFSGGFFRAHRNAGFLKNVAFILEKSDDGAINFVQVGTYDPSTKTVRPMENNTTIPVKEAIERAIAPMPIPTIGKRTILRKKHELGGNMD
jgi:hypothetical protein